MYKIAYQSVIPQTPVRETNRLPTMKRTRDDHLKTVLMAHMPDSQNGMPSKHAFGGLIS